LPGSTCLLLPEIIAAQVDVLPAQRRHVRQQIFVNVLSRIPQCLDCSFRVDRVPQHDGGHNEVKAARTIALVLEAPVADLPESVQEH